MARPKALATIGLLALLANAGVAVTLYAWRDSDAKIHSRWWCTRTDGWAARLSCWRQWVFLAPGAWLDLAVAPVMAGLALTSGLSKLRQAHTESHSHGRCVAH